LLNNERDACFPVEDPDVLDTRAPYSRFHVLPACVQDHISNVGTWNPVLDIVTLPEFAMY